MWLVLCLGVSRPSLLARTPSALCSLGVPPQGVKYLWRHLRQGLEPIEACRGNNAEAGGLGLGAAQISLIAEQHTPLAQIAALSCETVAADGTRKLLLRLADGLEVETVLIPPLPPTGRATATNSRARTTLCISSQVGCKQGCAFCATGRMGLIRNLSVDEILAQMWYGKSIVAAAGLPALANVVFMGMGEPADNARNVHDAVECLIDPQRFGLGRQSVTVSTVAPTPSAFSSLVCSSLSPAVNVQSLTPASASPLVSSGLSLVGGGEGLATRAGQSADDESGSRAADEGGDDESGSRRGGEEGGSGGSGVADVVAADVDAAVDAAVDAVADEGQTCDVDLGVVLAWSLHSADEEKRKLLVPTAKSSAQALRNGLCATLRRRPPRQRRVLSTPPGTRTLVAPNYSTQGALLLPL